MIAVLLLLSSCKKDIPGCTDYSADNYNSNATDNDGSCEYSGDFVFWTSQQFNYIDVTVSGITKSITLYYPSGGVDCGSNGCATFHLPVGSYNYYAEENATFGDWWSGTITVPMNGCSSLLLYQ